MIRLLKGDCLDLLSEVEDDSIDLVLSDLPYGTTACKWDSVIPFGDMWRQLYRVGKTTTPFVFTASQPFTSSLVNSNLKDFKYSWVWEKNRGSNFGSVRYAPMKEHEDVLVFYRRFKTFNAQRIPRSPKGKEMVVSAVKSSGGRGGDVSVYGNFDKGHSNEGLDPETRVPRSIIRFNCEVGFHPTQKPVTLMEYLVKTYTNENGTVLDTTMGSGSTGIAAVNLNRSFIGIEKEDKYFRIAEDRIWDSFTRFFDEESE